MIRKGRSTATVYYPSGFNGGGDPDLATIRIKTDGTLDVSNATCEMGQGFKKVAVQIAAETLGVDGDLIKFDNNNSDTAAFSMDTAGSRSTVISGSAVKAAAEDLIVQIKDFAAGQLGVPAQELNSAYSTALPGMHMRARGIARSACFLLRK
ncbi:MAG: molybdopterin-dependent oxidoreductase [Eubacterium sp.]|nr:molybdopterin-dependent oxidoreductase [Eubacterium sp.]